MQQLNRIIISRTDSIGDVVLTLPVAGWLHQRFPRAHILFLGRGYTKAVIQAGEFVDEFINWDEARTSDAATQAEFLRRANADAIVHVFPHKDIAQAAKAAAIPLRVGTTNRLFHWRTCNKRVLLSRKNSSLHEAQLNLRLLRPLGLKKTIAREHIVSLFGLTRLKPLREDLETRLATERFNLILHPKSKGSSKEWGEENFAALIRALPRQQFNIFITGTQAEGDRARSTLIEPFPFVHDLCGKMSLDELISFIADADGLVAGSTGPLHLAAALGIHAVGLYPSKRPTHPGRWAPLGRHVHVIEDGRPSPYDGFLDIAPRRVADIITSLLH